MKKTIFERKGGISTDSKFGSGKLRPRLSVIVGKAVLKNKKLLFYHLPSSTWLCVFLIDMLSLESKKMIFVLLL